MTKERDEAFARVAKLMERARADKGPEGRAARRLARQIMEKYGFTWTDPPRASRPPVGSTAPLGRRPRSTPIQVTIGGITVGWDGDRTLRLRLRFQDSDE